MQWCKRYLWPKKGRITGKFCAHNAKICQISFRIFVKSNHLLVWSKHFYNIQRDFASFVSRSPWIAIVQIVTKSHVPKTLLQGFFVKSGTNQLKFEQINFQKWLDKKTWLDGFALIWVAGQTSRITKKKVSNVDTGLASADQGAMSQNMCFANVTLTIFANLHSLSSSWKSLNKTFIETAIQVFCVILDTGDWSQLHARMSLLTLNSTFRIDFKMFDF